MIPGVGNAVALPDRDVFLACAWRPRGEVGRWKAAWPVLRAVYRRVLIVTPPDADAAQADELVAETEAVVVRASRPFWARYECLRHAVDLGASHVHYADGDRLLHWVATRPDELRDAAAQIALHDCLVVGRSPAAFATHPQAMQQTEAIINAVAAHLLGQPLDLGGGSRGLSHDEAAALVKHATPGAFGDAEWPILLQRLGFRVGYRAADGLDWETPDHHQEAVADPGRQQLIAAEYDTRVDRWAARVRTAHEIIAEALRATTQPLAEA